MWKELSPYSGFGGEGFFCFFSGLMLGKVDSSLIFQAGQRQGGIKITENNLLLSHLLIVGDARNRSLQGLCRGSE